MADPKGGQPHGLAQSPLSPEEIRQGLYHLSASISALVEVLLAAGKLTPADVAEFERRRARKVKLLREQPGSLKPGQA